MYFCGCLYHYYVHVLCHTCMSFLYITFGIARCEYLSFFLPFSLSLPLTPSHSLSLPLTPSHSLSLPLTSSHSLSLPLTLSHSLSLPLTPSHSLSLPLTPSHSLSLSLTPSHSLSLPLTLCSLNKIVTDFNHMSKVRNAMMSSCSHAKCLAPCRCNCVRYQLWPRGLPLFPLLPW